MSIIDNVVAVIVVVVAVVVVGLVVFVDVVVAVGVVVVISHSANQFDGEAIFFTLGKQRRLI